ncbi:MAG: hypothetical protein R1F52_05425 [Candidatus Nitrosoabyssus spongiisocia]|nr:MAG: hypothetical protein R1F52_05425 [Nitrosopumilaceae archaeon AB1(1)]
MDTLPLYVKVSSMLEFARLVCALERMPRISFMHKLNDVKVISVQMDLLKERPIIYYFPIGQEDGEFIQYGFKNGNEYTAIINSTKDSQFIYSPIIHIKSLSPNLLPESKELKEKYHPLELEDLTSLARISYGFEEAPFPLFAFPYKDKWMMGIFMNLNEEGASYFCFIRMNGNPNKSFLKYSANSGTAPEIVESPGSHGFTHIKVIKLEETHPLVYYEQLQD